MSRPLRVEYPDAWYNVMSRARLGQDSFPAREGYYSFIDLLKDTTEMSNMRIAAYCLMTTHALCWAQHNISLYKNYILDMFSKDKGLQVISYKGFISTQEPSEIIQRYSKSNMPSILGSDKFIKWVKERFAKKKKKKEIPESKKLCPEVIDIKKAVCNHYKIEDAALLKSRRGVENEARDLAIYMLRFIRGERLTIIGQEFNLNNYSSVSTAMERIKRKLESNKFKKQYEYILMTS